MGKIMSLDLEDKAHKCLFKCDKCGCILRVPVTDVVGIGYQYYLRDIRLNHDNPSARILRTEQQPVRGRRRSPDPKSLTHVGGRHCGGLMLPSARGWPRFIRINTTTLLNVGRGCLAESGWHLSLARYSDDDGIPQETGTMSTPRPAMVLRTARRVIALP